MMMMMVLGGGGDIINGGTVWGEKNRGGGELEARMKGSEKE